MRYKHLVDFLGEVFGDDVEIILHDVTDLENSVVAMSTTNLSGRTIGSPATNLILKTLKEGQENNKSYITNYEGVAQDGTTLRSSTYFIRDDNQKIIGMLCININYKKIEDIIGYLSKFVGVDTNLHMTNDVEHLSPSIKDVATSSIKEIVSSMNVPAERMSQQEKLEVVQRLNDNGIFLLKGIVSIVAEELSTSEATIYRYLGKMKKSELNLNL
ncbi:MAG: PAS domain-containing protein [Sporolactobacillus sp.]